jgi:hypothetical protein
MAARSNWAGMVAGLRATPQDIHPVHGVVSGNRFIPVPYIMRAVSYVEPELFYLIASLHQDSPTSEEHPKKGVLLFF